MFTLYNLYQQPGTMLLGLLFIAVWTIIWKGIALWHSARNKQKGWFIALLILNTVGLLPIIYLIWFKPKAEQHSVQENREKKPTMRAAPKRIVKRKKKKTSRRKKG